MGLLTFSGGIHPYEGKDLTKDKPVREYLPKGECVYPLSQHIGAPAVPIVKRGDRVLVGQKIAGGRICFGKYPFFNLRNGKNDRTEDDKWR